MSKEREEIVAMLQRAGRTSLTIHADGELQPHLIICGTKEGALKAAREIGEKAIKAGNAVTWADGSKEWITAEAATVPGDPSFSLVFHEDGDRIRIRRFRVTLAPDGELSRRELRSSWRNCDKIFNEE